MSAFARSRNPVASPTQPNGAEKGRARVVGSKPRPHASSVRVRRPRPDSPAPRPGRSRPSRRLHNGRGGGQALTRLPDGCAPPARPARCRPRRGAGPGEGSGRRLGLAAQRLSQASGQKSPRPTRSASPPRGLRRSGAAALTPRLLSQTRPSPGENSNAKEAGQLCSETPRIHRSCWLGC